MVLCKWLNLVDQFLGLVPDARGSSFRQIGPLVLQNCKAWWSFSLGPWVGSSPWTLGFLSSGLLRRTIRHCLLGVLGTRHPWPSGGSPSTGDMPLPSALLAGIETLLRQSDGNSCAVSRCDGKESHSKLEISKRLLTQILSLILVRRIYSRWNYEKWACPIHAPNSPSDVSNDREEPQRVPIQ